MNKLNLVNCEDIDDDLMAQFRHAASRLAERLRIYRRHIADMQTEFERIATERDEWKRDAGKLAESSVKAACITRTRETIDGVECERIRGLDVIVPVGLIPDGEDPKEVRALSLPIPSRWLSSSGWSVPPCHKATGDSIGDLSILLADNPAPATVPTWTPPAGLRTGRYVSKALWLVCADDEHQIYHEHLEQLIPSYTKPTEGVWHVEPGKATYLGPNQEATQ